MLIENPDAFKSWLTSVLEPLCDADPEALAKYVFALVKKDKAADALRQGMLEQLDVFLQAETKPFVELLFKTIETQDYLTIPNTNPPNPNPAPVKKDPDALIVKEIKPIIPVSTLPNLSESINGSGVAPPVKKPPVVPEETAPPQAPAVSTTTGGGGSKREPRKSDSEKEEPRRRRNRSRSRSWEPRTARERSPRRSRPWRNKSPPARRGGWRRSRSGSPPGVRLRSRSRSPRHGGYRGGATRYRNRSPPRSPTRSRSRDKDKKEKDGKEENSGGATPTQDSNHGDTDMRLTSTTQSIQSVVSAAAAAAVGPAAPGGPAELYKRRCRDFDEKGYCMRGEMCPYDHGVDPVVLEDTALTRVLAFGPNGAPLEPQHPLQPTHHPPRPIMEYNPSAPGMWHHRAGFRPRVMSVGPRGPPGTMPPGGPPFVPLPSMQRELINVPVTDMQPGGGPHGGGFKRRAPPNHDFSQDSNSTPPKRKQGNFDFNRLGPRASAPKNPTNCSLELKKVPRGLNNITHLNNHFSKFGKIINIQVNFEGDCEGALVTFSSHAEANAAYRSTEAVLNNRFIKVFWHSSLGGAERQENVPPVPQNAIAARPVKDRLGQPVNCNKVFNLVQPKAAAVAETAGEEPQDEGAPQGAKSAYVPSTAKSQDSRALASAAIVKGQEILAAKEQLKKKHEEKRKEALKITQDLRKRKQELLEKQLAQQKLLIEKLEKTNPTGQQRELLMTTIKTVQESIESIRKDMLSSSIAPPASTSPRGSNTPRKSKEEAQREVLDAELDLITRQAEGGDTSELQRRLAELRAQAQSLSRGGGAPGGPRRGRGGAVAGVRHRGTLHHPARGSLVLDRTKGGPPGAKVHHVVDHRPTMVLVSGYESDESESVLAHFAQFGEISEYITDNSTPSIILKYKTRKEAEVALLKGRNFQDRTLSVTWCAGAPRGAAPVMLVAPQPAIGAPLEGKVPEEDGDAVAVTAAEIDKDETETTNEKQLEKAEVKDEEKEVGVEEEEGEVGVERGPAEAPPASQEDQLLEGDDENVIGAVYTEEALLQDDEEEEETEDDRSWRR